MTPSIAPRETPKAQREEGETWINRRQISLFGFEPTGKKTSSLRAPVSGRVKQRPEK